MDGSRPFVLQALQNGPRGPARAEDADLFAPRQKAVVFQQAVEPEIVRIVPFGPVRLNKTVLTAPMAAASGEIQSSSFMTATLWGIVTLTPR